jgi:2-methylcitrate dehydratase PrpD
MEKTLVAKLAEFIVDTKYEDLPKETISKVKEYILDVIGCTVAASTESQANILSDVLLGQGGSGYSSVFARGAKTSAMHAAMLNGTMGHTFDFDDDHREGTMHPSVSVFPAVFAMGEERSISGKDFLRALILGLEIMIRIGESLLGKAYYQGFHLTGVCGIFGAAAGCASLMGLDPIRAKYALGIAGSFSAGTLECIGEGAWQKPLQAGFPAMGGVLAALLGEKGYLGSGTVLDGRSGLIRAWSYKDQFDYGRITETLGNKWEMMDTSIKVHACCRFAGSSADCALDLYRQGVRAKDVKSITAKLCDWAIKTLFYPEEQKRKPQMSVDAKFSLPWAVGVAICKNSTGIDQFKTEALNDQEVLDLAGKVKWELDPAAEAVYPKAYPATLVAELNDGRAFTSHVDYPKGDPENPATKEECLAKFLSITEKFFDQERREELVRMVNRLEEIPNIRELGDLVS